MTHCFLLSRYDPNISPSQLESDLKKVSHWAYKWKMTFNFEISKLAQELYFLEKTVKLSHPSINFNSLPVAPATCQKNLDL